MRNVNIDKKRIIFLDGALLSYSVIPTYYLKYRWSYESKKRAKDRKVAEAKQLYLTFDDGPDERYTGELLDLLKHYSVKATFFVVAEQARKHPELIRRMQEEGHRIGLHSAAHKSSLMRGERYTREDFLKSLYYLEQMGCQVKAYRPPWGHLNFFTLYWLKKLDMDLVLWDVMAQDWSKKETVETIYNKLLRRVFPGAVICLHDGRGEEGAPARTIQALRRAIPALQTRGYAFCLTEDRAKS